MRHTLVTIAAAALVAACAEPGSLGTVGAWMPDTAEPALDAVGDLEVPDGATVDAGPEDEPDAWPGYVEPTWLTCWDREPFAESTEEHWRYTPEMMAGETYSWACAPPGLVECVGRLFRDPADADHFGCDITACRYESGCWYVVNAGVSGRKPEEGDDRALACLCDHLAGNNICRHEDTDPWIHHGCKWAKGRNH